MILLTTALAGTLSISAAAVLSYSLCARVVERMRSLSTGLLLGAALLVALPQAFTGATDPRSLCTTLLAGLLAFFLLEKCATLRYTHQRAHQRAPQRPAVSALPALAALSPLPSMPALPGMRAGKAGWMVLVGDGLHHFTDGIVIAAAFTATPALGLLTALAITAHATAREVGEFIVLLDGGFSRRRAYLCNLLCSCLAPVGGAIGFVALGRGLAWLPYVLVVASSGFLYIALSDLIPKIQRPAPARDTVLQLLLLGAGVTLVLVLPANAAGG